MNDLTEKWNKQYAVASVEIIPPSDVLEQNVHLLPASGKALDYACGLGGNALLLAEKKLETHAWDISQVALTALDQRAKSRKLELITEVRDVETCPPETSSFDVIVVSRFLHRPSFPALLSAIREGGLLFYQTFIRDKINSSGPNNPDYLLRSNELLTLCNTLNVLVYREEGKQGEINAGWRNQAMIVARKPV